MKYFKTVLLAIILIFALVFLSKLDYIESNRLQEYSFGKSIKSERVLDYARGDIDGDGEKELVLITKKFFSKYGAELVIYSSTDEEIYRRDFSDLKPWKLALGDVDGDGIDELSLGVYKKTIFHPVMAKRPFIYRYEDGELYPKWRGSRLARPFEDYIFYDIDENGTDEILAIEILEDGKKLINTYKWRGFGFEGYRESRAFEDMEALRLEDDQPYIDLRDDSDFYKARIELTADSIKLKNEGRK